MAHYPEKRHRNQGLELKELRARRQHQRRNWSLKVERVSMGMWGVGRHCRQWAQLEEKPEGLMGSSWVENAEA